MNKNITKFILFRIFLRSHLIMSVWNFQRMLNLGFLFSLIPVFHRLYPDKDRLKDVYERHLKFFNTQPYFASYILGLVIKKEEKLAQYPSDNPDSDNLKKSIDSVKNSFMGPLGALGDVLFWETLRPFLGLLTLFIMLWMDFQSNWLILASLFFLIMYNIFHEYIRFHGIYTGYRLEDNAIQSIYQMNIQKIVYKIQNYGILIAGIIIGLLSFSNYPVDKINSPNIYMDSIIRIGIGTALTGIFYYGLKYKITSTRLFFMAIVILLILDFIKRGL